MTEQTNRSAAYQAASPHPDLKSLEKLVGMWNLSGDTQGQITYEWMEGGFFLLQHVDMEHAGNHIKGLEVIGHLRPFGEEQSSDIKSRFYSSTGDTLDYVYEPSYGISNKFHLRGYSPSFFSALYLEGSKIGAVFPGGS